MPRRYWIGREAAAVRELTDTSDPVEGMQLLASRLLDEGGWDSPPAPPRILASFRGIEDVRLVAMPSAGRLIYRDGSLLIEVNESHSQGKRNFTTNHEVSHTLMPTYAGQAIEDSDTGTFSSGDEEELLCDIGAAALLLPPRWLRPHVLDGGPSIATLFNVADIFESSLEAAARQIAGQDCWPIAFISWEDGFRKDEHIAPNQMFVPGLEDFGGPQPKMRISRSYTTQSFGHFIPHNKSIDNTSLIATCNEADPFTWGIEDIDLGKGPIKMYCENHYVPYRRADAVCRRVLSLLMIAPRSYGEPAKPSARQTEIL